MITYTLGCGRGGAGLESHQRHRDGAGHRPRRALQLRPHHRARGDGRAPVHERPGFVGRAHPGQQQHPRAPQRPQQRRARRVHHQRRQQPHPEFDSHNNYDVLESGGSGDGFGCHSSGGNNILRGCRSYDNSDDGYDFINAAGPACPEFVLVPQRLRSRDYHRRRQRRRLQGRWLRFAAGGAPRPGPRPTPSRTAWRRATAPRASTPTTTRRTSTSTTTPRSTTPRTTTCRPTPASRRATSSATTSRWRPGRRSAT